MRLSSVVWIGCVAIAGAAIIWSRPAGSDRAPMSARPMSIVSTAVRLHPDDPTVSSVGAFRYAGGLWLTSRDSDELHGLSDLDVTEGGTLAAVTDFGSWIEARLVFDREGRLIGLNDARVKPLAGPDGRALRAKSEADGEGMALLPSGHRLVSFEEHDRILAYTPGVTASWPAPMPATRFVFNQAMEALSADPDTAADAYLVGVEESGDVWSCRLAGGCVRTGQIDKPKEFGLVALRRLPGGVTAHLLRAFDTVRGSRIVLVVTRAGVEDRLELSRPLTVDNFEGLAAVPGEGGAIRFYLVSDDNGGAPQRTLLVAFDWPRETTSR